MGNNRCASTASEKCPGPHSEPNLRGDICGHAYILEKQKKVKNNPNHVILRFMTFPPVTLFFWINLSIKKWKQKSKEMKKFFI